jgi:transcription antitermination protein NusB
MINRRNIRIKAMQTIYEFELAGITPSYEEIEKSLHQKFNTTGQLLIYLLNLTVETAKYVEFYANQKANKHITTKADLSVNTKIAGNDVVWQILESKSFIQALKNHKINAITNDDFVKALFLDLVASKEYEEYIASENRNPEDEINIMQFIFKSLIIDNEAYEYKLIELFQNFDDDIEMVYSFVNYALENTKKTNFIKLISKDKFDYAVEIVNTYFTKKQVCADLIIPKLKNWDPERVAKLDMIILYMGVCELMYFETIPVKVTINEYIDVAKDYSTAQSGQFVNGILDSINKDLESQNKIQKITYRKL